MCLIYLSLMHTKNLKKKKKNSTCTLRKDFCCLLVLRGKRSKGISKLKRNKWKKLIENINWGTI